MSSDKPYVDGRAEAILGVKNNVEKRNQANAVLAHGLMGVFAIVVCFLATYSVMAVMPELVRLVWFGILAIMFATSVAFIFWSLVIIIRRSH